MGEIRHVAVVGAGAMGSGITHVMARYERTVHLVDVSQKRLEAARAGIAANLDRQIRKGEVDAAARQEILDRIQASTDIAAAVATADLAIEAVPESAELKASVLREVDAALPANAILASNTSAISITWLAAQTSRPDRVIGMHFFNPVPIMRLVEVVRGLQTSESTATAVIALSRALDKVPVEVNDYPGFVSNRVLMPMINEAVFCLMEGVADAEAIDSVMKLGMGHPMGPLALADFIGLDVCLSILEVLHRDLGDDRYRPCPLLRSYVAAGWLGRKTGRGFFRYDS